MRLQEFRHDRAVAVGAGHAQAERLHEREIIQHGKASSCVPMAERSCRTGFIIAVEPSAAPAMRSEWPPTLYFVSE